jgi:phage FluMu protein Com
MQIRCYHCHKPFAIGKQETHAALDILENGNLSHYDAPCPHCRRVNRISRKELERSAPDWKPSPQERAPDG